MGIFLLCTVIFLKKLGGGIKKNTLTPREMKLWPPWKTHPEKKCVPTYDGHPVPAPNVLLGPLRFCPPSGSISILGSCEAKFWIDPKMLQKWTFWHIFYFLFKKWQKVQKNTKSTKKAFWANATSLIMMYRPLIRRFWLFELYVLKPTGTHEANFEITF